MESNWTIRRDRHLRRVRFARLVIRALLVGPGFAVLLYLLLIWISLFVGHDVAKAYLPKLIASLPWIGPLIESAGERLPGIKAEDELVVLGIGYLLGLFLCRRCVDRLEGWLVRPHDDWTFEPIREVCEDLPSNSRDPGLAMPWQAPRDAATSAIWTGLLTRIGKGSDQVRRRWHLRLTPVEPFAAALLTGAPGAGKSRLAVEIARHLGRRHRFGRKPQGLADLLGRFLIWLRFMTRLARYREDDPWDTGLIDITRTPDAALALAGWRPRRPTLLLLDQASEARLDEWVRALGGAAFSHPVRLLAICQHDVSIGTRGRIVPEDATFVLPEGWFEQPQVRALARLLGPRLTSLHRTEQFDRVIDVTGGNPLLVQLMLESIGKAGWQASTSRNRLLDERCDQLIRELSEAGIDTRDGEVLRCLAVAGLAGEPGCPVEILNRHFSNRAPLAPQLARVFPRHHRAGVDLSTTMPAIGPLMIADHFARRVIAAQDPARSATRIVDALLDSSPDAWLAAFARLAASDDQVGQAFRQKPSIPPTKAPLRVAMAKAYAGSAFGGGCDTELAIERVGALVDEADPDCRASVADGIAAALETLIVADRARRERDLRSHLETGPGEAGRLVRPDRYFRSRPIVLLAHCIFAKLADAKAQSGGRMAALERLAALLGDAAGRFDLDRRTEDDVLCRSWLEHLDPAKGDDRLEAAVLLEGFERCRELLNWFAPHSRQYMLHLAGLAEGVGGSEGLALAAALRVVAWSDDATRCGLAAAELEGLLKRRDPQRRLAETRELLGALSRLSFANQADPKLVLRLARRIDRIVKREKVGEWEWARNAAAAAWRNLALSAHDDIDLCEDAASRAERLVEPAEGAPGNEDAAYILVTARCALARAQHDLPERCAATVEKIEAQCAAPGQLHLELIQRARCEGWARYAYAARGQLEMCRPAFDVVEFIGTAPPLLIDPEAQKLRLFAHSALIVGLVAKPTECLAVAEAAEKIVADARIAPMAEVNLLRAIAWRTVAAAFLHDPDLCRKAVERVEKLAGAPALIHDFHLQFHRAVAWSELAFALAGNADLCRRAVERTLGIIDSSAFADDRAMIHTRCRSMRAFTDSPGSSLPESLAMAEAIDVAMSAPAYLDDHEMQLERVGGWMSVARKGSQDAPLCERAVRIIEQVAGRPLFRDRAEMRFARAAGWRALAAARPAGSAARQEAVRMVERLTSDDAAQLDPRMREERLIAASLLTAPSARPET